MKEVLKELYAKAKAYYATEPARVNSAIAALLVGVGAPLVIGGIPILGIVALALGFLLTGSATRAQVYPQKTVEAIKQAKKKRAAKR